MNFIEKIYRTCTEFTISTYVSLDNEIIVHYEV